jgi:hypothetical protein
MKNLKERRKNMLRKKYNDSPEAYETMILNLVDNPQIGVMELSDMIENMIENKPSSRDEDRRKLWKRNINKLIDEINSKFGKLYKRQ